MSFSQIQKYHDGSSSWAWSPTKRYEPVHTPTRKDVGYETQQLGSRCRRGPKDVHESSALGSLPLKTRLSSFNTANLTMRGVAIWKSQPFTCAGTDHCLWPGEVTSSTVSTAAAVISYSILGAG